jgi:hypothetical protein
MPDEILDSDVQFGRQILLVCTAIIVASATLLAVLAGEWWQVLALGWILCGATSIMIQVVIDFGYIRMVPRFDAVYSYTLSIIAGPFSLIRTLRDLV